MLKIKRRKTRTVRIGNVRIGSGHPIAIQSMAKTRARDIEASVRQIRELEAAGCEVVRLAVENLQDAAALGKIRRRVGVPLVADIHFDYRLALAAIDAGVDKVRLNPGNIFKPGEVREVASAAKKARIPVRIGANSGSLRQHGRDTAASLVKSVLAYLKIFEKKGFYDLVVSLKGSHVLDTIEAYKKIAVACDYPLHLGVTATGLPMDGIVKSSVGIGELLFHGIGDTIRVSLLDRPQNEVAVARSLLNSLGLRHFGPELVCCPTCGRCEVDLSSKAKRIEGWLLKHALHRKGRSRSYKIAVMGCIVNGPGEAREADLGIAFSKHKGILFKKGRIVQTVGLKKGETALLELLEGEME
ncbi:MAG: flavodoxin-dependent (E)-4-hydroxy-3-methylbut-2-enyl-diphosphate synthase [Candidatus Omnitrophota bacterium]|jgi:(E)-4-hydroxy-3-methylbut-2-enyl-diphosphate synthase